MHVRFEKVIVIGSGKIACDSVDILNRKSVVLEVIESKYSALSMLHRICIKCALSYCMIEDRKQLKIELLSKLAGGQEILVISANNEFIFPQQITEMPNVTIINFHYAYLPDYRGMNIPTWVIYNEEPYTGVTWHYVNSSIDAGRILIQKKLPLKGNETAFEIVRRGMELGRAAFDEMIDTLLEKPIAGEKNENGRYYYTKAQLPNDGILDANCPAVYAWKMLRAFDYKGVNIFPKLKIKLPDKTIHMVEKYRVQQDGQVDNKNSRWREDYKISGEGIEIDLQLTR